MGNRPLFIASSLLIHKLHSLSRGHRPVRRRRDQLPEQLGAVVACDEHAWGAGVAVLAGGGIAPGVQVQEVREGAVIRLMADGHKLVLWTVREGKLLDEAVDWCRERGVEFSAINETLRADTNEHSHNTRKIDADIYIDDCNIGGRFDWDTVYHMIHDNLTYYDIIREAKRDAKREAVEAASKQKEKKKGWFGF